MVVIAEKYIVKYMDLSFIFIVMRQKCLFEIEEVEILCNNIGERCVVLGLHS
jgi:hypothetical protein